MSEVTIGKASLTDKGLLVHKRVFGKWRSSVELEWAHYQSYLAKKVFLLTNS